MHSFRRIRNDPSTYVIHNGDDHISGHCLFETWDIHAAIAFVAFLNAGNGISFEEVCEMLRSGKVKEVRGSVHDI